MHRRFDAAASSLKGPAAPSILRTVLRINCPSISSNRIGCGSVIDISGVTMDEGFGDCFGGYFFMRTSPTVSGVVLDPMRLSPPLLSSANNLSAALTLPSIISLAKVLVVCWVDFSSMLLFLMN